ITTVTPQTAYKCVPLVGVARSDDIHQVSIPAEQAPGEIPAPAPCAVCENRSEPTGGYVAYVMETRTVIITGCAVTHCMKKVKFLFT
ncbi:hypothetical protein QTP38_30885, partial [Klebsiella oxytoca]|uniref:hypothetical protein n=1 Tax=Klebsiella oxytoca TaxID=571 RepID=UPI0025938789